MKLRSVPGCTGCLAHGAVGGTKSIISATDTVFLEADTAFSVSEKTLGGAAVVVFPQQPTTAHAKCYEVRSAAVGAGNAPGPIFEDATCNALP